MYSDTGGGKQTQSTVLRRCHWQRERCQFPIFFLFVIATFLFIIPLHSSSLQPSFLRPSIIPISPVMAGSDSCKGRGVLWERLSGGCQEGLPAGIVFHWRGESIMPHGEENTGAFLLAKASRDKTQNTLFPVFHQLTIYRAPLAQARRPLIARQCLWSRPEQRATWIDPDSLKNPVLGWLMWQIRVTPEK